MRHMQTSRLYCSHDVLVHAHPSNLSLHLPKIWHERQSIGHIVGGPWKVLCICLTQAASDIQLPSTLPEPLPIDNMFAKWKGTVMFYYHCPHTLDSHSTLCNKLVTQNCSYRGCQETELLKHVDAKHGGIRKPLCDGTWIQVVPVLPAMCRKGAAWSSHIYHFPAGWVPLVTLDNPPDASFRFGLALAPKTEKWMDVLHWPPYLQSFGEAASIDTLRALARLPSKRYVHTFQSDNPLRWVEMGLLVFHKISIPYLQNSNVFLSNQHYAVRARVTDGWACTFIFTLVKKLMSEWHQTVINCKISRSCFGNFLRILITAHSNNFHDDTHCSRTQNQDNEQSKHLQT